MAIMRTQQLNDMQVAVKEMKAAPQFSNIPAQSVLDGVADPVMVIGSDYRVIAMNETARLEHFGNGPLPDTVFCYEATHHKEEPCSSVDHHCPMIEALTTRKPVTSIHSHLTADGTEAVFEILASPVFDEKGVFMYVIETNRDVTHRMRAEKALRESEAQLKTVIDSINAGVVLIDPETHMIVDINLSAQEIIGKSKESIVGSICHGYICPAEEGKCPITDLSQTMNLSERKLINSRGEYINILKSAAIVKLKDRTFLIESFVDITNCKVSEEALKDREELRRKNAKLSTLYEFTIAAGKNLEMEKLLPEVLNALIRMDRFGVEKRAALFRAEEKSLHLAAVVGLPGAVSRSCSVVRYGECHCGTAAEKGDVLILTHSECEERHPIACRGLRPHGHVILPFKTGAKVDGVLCLHTGLDTYIDGSSLELLRSIGNQLGVAVERSRLFEEMRSSSLHDPLTGLGNRRYMKMQIDHYINAAKRYGRRLSLVMIDIDHFKSYNDTYGHVRGDMVLTDLAALLRRQMRDADQIFRYGGEEFLVMLPETDLTDACIAAERLRSAVEREGMVTISLGVASYGDFVQSSDVLITKTDTALYMAKQKGRNRVEPYCRP